MEEKRNAIYTKISGDKIVYVDSGVTKVLKGEILEEDLHTITIRAMPINSIITVGKAALVKIERGGY